MVCLMLVEPEVDTTVFPLRSSTVFRLFAFLDTNRLAVTKCVIVNATCFCLSRVLVVEPHSRSTVPLVRNVTRFVALLLTAVTLGLLAAMPLVAAWRIPAGQCIAPVSLNPLKPGEQAAMPVVAGQCAIAGSSLKQPELTGIWLDW